MSAAPRNRDTIDQGQRQDDPYRSVIRRGALFNFVGGVAKLAQPIVILLVTWLWGPAISGLYLLGQSLLDVVSAVLSAGYTDATTIFVSRYVERATEDADARRALYRVLANTFALAIGLSAVLSIVALLLVRPLVDSLLPGYRELLPGLYWLILSLVPRAMGLVAIAATKGVMRMEYDAFVNGLLQPLALLVGTLAVFALGGAVSALYALQLGVELLVCALSVAAFRRHFSLSALRVAFQAWEWDRQLLAFAIPQSLNLTFNRYITRIDSIILASFGLAEEQLAYFATAAYLTSNLGQIRAVFSGALGPVLARHHARGEQAALQQALGRVARWTTSLAVPVILALTVLRVDVLHLFSKSYGGDSRFVAVLLIPPLTNCAFGMAGACLMFTGHTRVTLANSLGVAVLNTLLNYLLIPRYGVLGAATATALATSLQTAMQMVELWYLERLHIPISAIWKPWLGFAFGGVALALLWDPAELQAGGRVAAASALVLGYSLLMQIVGLEELRAIGAQCRAAGRAARASAALALAPLKALAPSALRSSLLRELRQDRLVTGLALGAGLLQLTVIGWDQPSAFGWENDGVAPRDFFRGVFANLSPGNGHRYPLFHNLVLLLLALPILLVCALAGSLSPTAVVQRVTSTAAMSALSLTIKTFHVAIGVALTLLVARIARRLFGPWAGRGATLCMLSSLTIGYYARSSNLDVPYMFWTVLAFDRLLTVIERGELSDYALLGLFMAASVATKDQAYASYVLAMPLALWVVPWRMPRVFAAGADHFKRLKTTLRWGALGYLILAGVVFNPTGFVFRLRLLSGPNSQEWKSYASSAQGLALQLADLWSAQSEFFWNVGGVMLCWLGVVLACVGSFRTQQPRVMRLVPLIAALSSVLTFTLPVARCEHRFLLPANVWLSVYGGAALAWLLALPARARWLAVVPLAALTLSTWRSVTLALTQWGDARRGVEQLLAELPVGSTVETYGFAVYQPRFDISPAAPYHLQRVAREPLKTRAQLRGAEELQAAYGEAGQRAPDVIVISEGFADLFRVQTPRPGEMLSQKRATWLSDQDAVRYFAAATQQGIAGYRLQVFETQLPAWARALGARPISIHDRSTAQRYWVLRREPSVVSPATSGQSRLKAERL